MIPYFIHNISSCGGQLFLLANSIKVLATYGIGSKSLRIGMAQLIQTKETGNTKFFCSSCEREIDLEDAGCFCSNCRELFNLKNLFRLSGGEEIGGIYCESCIRNSTILSTTPRVSLSTIALKTDFKSIL